MTSRVTPVALDSETAIRALAKEFETCYNARDIEKLLLLFTDDARLLVPNHDPVQGHVAIRALLQEGFDQFDPVSNVIEPEHVEHAGDIGFSMGRHMNNVRLPDGNRMEDHGKWVTALRREHGQWKLVALIYNTNLPMPGH